ncbi:16752_t:CDS:1, partial [Gigaspora margarita]
PQAIKNISVTTSEIDDNKVLRIECKKLEIQRNKISEIDKEVILQKASKTY